MEAAWRPASHLAVLQADDEALAAGGAAEHLGVADGGVELPLALALAAGRVEAQLLVVAEDEVERGEHEEVDACGVADEWRWR